MSKREEQDRNIDTLGAIQFGQKVYTAAQTDEKIAEAIAAIPEPDMDDEPTPGSDNAVKSNGVYDAIAYAKGELKEEIEKAVTSVFRYKGSVDTYEELPECDSTDSNDCPAVGDVYDVRRGYGDMPPGTNWAWNGESWDPLGGSLSEFVTREEADGKYATLEGLSSHVGDKNNPHEVTGQQVGVLTNSGVVGNNLVVSSSISDGAVTSGKLAKQLELYSGSSEPGEQAAIRVLDYGGEVTEVTGTHVDTEFVSAGRLEVGTESGGTMSLGTVEIYGQAVEGSDSLVSVNGAIEATTFSIPGSATRFSAGTIVLEGAEIRSGGYYLSFGREESSVGLYANSGNFGDLYVGGCYPESETCDGSSDDCAGKLGCEPRLSLQNAFVEWSYDGLSVFLHLANDENNVRIQLDNDYVLTDSIANDRYASQDDMSSVQGDVSDLSNSVSQVQSDVSQLQSDIGNRPTTQDVEGSIANAIDYVTSVINASVPTQGSSAADAIYLRDPNTSEIYQIQVVNGAIVPTKIS